MKIRELMTVQPESCGPETNLSAAAMIMWRNDCGVVPVVGENHKVLGVLTDRDICMAVATRHCAADTVCARDLMSGRLVSVGPDDDVEVALDLMRLEQVRRLPVVGPDDTLVGIISMNDLILHTATERGRRHGTLTPETLLHALKGISMHRAAPLIAERDMPALAGAL